MNWLVKWGVKKWALKIVNGALDTYAESIDAAMMMVMRAIAKAEAVMAFLKSLKAKMEDRKIDDDEAMAILAECEA